MSPLSASLLSVSLYGIGRLSIMHSPGDLCSPLMEPGLHTKHLMFDIILSVKWHFILIFNLI